MRSRSVSLWDVGGSLRVGPAVVVEGFEVNDVEVCGKGDLFHLAARGGAKGAEDLLAVVGVHR